MKNERINYISSFSGIQYKRKNMRWKQNDMQLTRLLWNNRFYKKS